ncbi:response regulator transcription factor [Pseudobacteroides cellulosolvens]|uniref:response regulator transcription factor n=1 Tax=Pseudobacteroides cellulosolvens TaxID=35825 RepID=UPI00056B85E4|nr:response regulator transcription factor [Pseudobacteroides cellulosolvens]
MEKIKVLLVEDDYSWQSAMSRFLSREEDILLSGMVKTKHEAIDFIKSIAVDVVLMDINLSENNLDGIEAAKEISDISNTKIIMLTSLKRDDIIIDSFTAGAMNFVYKEDYQALPDIIRNISKNTTPYELLIKEYQKLKKEEQLKDLSYCEKQVYLLMEENKTRRQIQADLDRSENTVKKLIHQVLKKLNVKSSKEAVEKVNKMGIEKKTR